MASGSPLVARKTWRTLEPLHGMIYFAPEATTRYAQLGLDATAGYFASRSAPMGQVAAATVIATFFNFHPRIVRGSIPAAWERTTPTLVLEARLAAAGEALRRLLGPAVGSPEVVRAAVLARRAAERATDRPGGRPLFAGHADLDWPDEPHLVLWHAQSLLREFRGDGHIAALLAAGVGPLQALVVHAATGEVPAEALRTTRAFTVDEWDAGVEAVRSRGWLATGAELALSPAGTEHHQRVEAMTDELSSYPYGALGEEACEELRTICRPLSRAVVGAADPGSPFALR